MQRYRFLMLVFAFFCMNVHLSFAGEVSSMARQLQRVQEKAPEYLASEKDVRIDLQNEATVIPVSTMESKLQRIQGEHVEEISIEGLELEKVTVSLDDEMSRDSSAVKPIYVQGVATKEKGNSDISAGSCHSGFVSTWGIAVFLNFIFLRKK